MGVNKPTMLLNQQRWWLISKLLIKPTNTWGLLTQNGVQPSKLAAYENLNRENEHSLKVNYSNQTRICL